MTVCLALAWWASNAPAQELGPGSTPRGVVLEVIGDAYLVDGATAQEILDQMNALGPGGGWMRTPYRYRWSTEYERIPLASGLPSSTCRTTEFQVSMDVTTSHPRWVPPEDADPALVAAWEDFTQLIVARWEQNRSIMVARAASAVRLARRVEEPCAFINRRLQALVREAFTRAADDDQERVTLRWPPEGHSDLLAPVTAGDRRVAVGPDESPIAEPEPDRALPELAPVVTTARDIDEAVRMDMDRGGARAIVVDLSHLGERQFREGFGTLGSGADSAASPESEFVFPAFTEVLIAALAAGLASRGEIDLDAPIAGYRVGLSPGLGSTTLNQLLSHRAGLDNAQVPDSADWNQLLDGLSDRVLFTQPGAVFSYSRYSYPLAALVLESALGLPVEDAIQSAVLDPLGLDRTFLGPRDADAARDGLPATHSVVADITRFWTAWLDGQLPGTGPEYLDSGGAVESQLDGRRFESGYWYDVVGDVPRVSLICGSSRRGYSAGFQVYPDTRTIMVFWGRFELPVSQGVVGPSLASLWPKESVRFVIGAMAGALGLGNDVFRPTELSGGTQPGLAGQRCSAPAVSSQRIQDFGPRVSPGDWPGRYLNGEWYFELLEHDGYLASPVDPTHTPYSVRHYGDDVYFTDRDIPGGPSIGFPIRLMRDAAGRRYVVLGVRAYLHEDDTVDVRREP